jgi:hypothetical protein
MVYDGTRLYQLKGSEGNSFELKPCHDFSSASCQLAKTGCLHYSKTQAVGKDLGFDFFGKCRIFRWGRFTINRLKETRRTFGHTGRSLQPRRWMLR